MSFESTQFDSQHEGQSHPSLVDWAYSIPFLIVFSVLMLSFDLAAKLWPGKAGRRKLEVCLERASLMALRLTGASFTFEGLDNIPLSGPCLIVSNHQSLFDIPLIEIPTEHLRPHFISKKELAKWIPAASVMLRVNGHYLIDRTKGLEAKRIIEIAAKNSQLHVGTLVLFPEGTRARDGAPKTMKSGGFYAFLQNCPEAYVLPVSISGSWLLTRFKMMPVPRNSRVSVTFHPPVKGSANDSELFASIESLIRSKAG